MGDFIDTLAVLKTTWSLVWLILAHQISSAAFSFASILIIKYSSGVHKWLIDSLRCAAVWAFGLILHYLWDRTSAVGEQWTLYSYLQMAGFSLIVLGQLVYSDFVVLPCFENHLLTDPTSSTTLAQE